MEYDLRVFSTEHRYQENVSRNTGNIKQAFITAVIAGILLTLSVPTNAVAQTVVIETNFVDFMMELNPTDNPNLIGHVENFLKYVQAGVYNSSIINRSVEDFVIQMGNFTLSPPLVSNLTTAGFTDLPRFDPVIVDADGNGQVDFDTAALSNMRGEVALALSGSPNSGSNSFYINLGDNSFLDTQNFIPFARIVDMAPIDQIAELERNDFTSVAGVRPNNLIYTDVPVVNNDFFLVIEDVRVVPEPSGLILLAVGIVSSLAVRRRLRTIQ